MSERRQKLRLDLRSARCPFIAKSGSGYLPRRTPHQHCLPKFLSQRIAARSGAVERQEVDRNTLSRIACRRWFSLRNSSLASRKRRFDIAQFVFDFPLTPNLLLRLVYCLLEMPNIVLQDGEVTFIDLRRFYTAARI